MRMKRIYVVAIFVSIILLSVSPVYAERSRVIDGEGVLSEDRELINSIWRLGLCEIIPDDEYGYEVAEWAYGVWPGYFSDTGRFTTTEIGNVNPALISASEIIEIGTEYNVDALISGRINQAKVRRSGSSRMVRIEIAFQVYETSSGTLIWERTIKKDRSVNEDEEQMILRRFAGNIAYDMINVMINDGLLGQDIGNNSPPEISFSQGVIEIKTSLIRIRGSVTDDFSLVSVRIFSGNADSPLFDWTGEDESVLDFDLIVNWDELQDEELVIRTVDSLGIETDRIIPVIGNKPNLEGLIANVTGESVFINVGYFDGVDEGLLFNVVSEVEIIDPESGDVLGKTTVNTGIIEVESVEDDFAICIVVEGNIDDFNTGDRVW